MPGVLPPPDTLDRSENRMKEREMRWVWYGGSFLGLMVTRALGHRFPVASVIAFCATGVWFGGWLMRDNLRFKNEIAAQRQRLAERKAAVRAARDSARRGGPDESRS